MDWNLSPDKLVIHDIHVSQQQKLDASEPPSTLHARKSSLGPTTAKFPKLTSSDTDTDSDMFEVVHSRSSSNADTVCESSRVDSGIDIKKTLHIDLPKPTSASLLVRWAEETMSPAPVSPTKILWFPENNPKISATPPLRSALRKSPSPSPRQRSISSPSKLESEDPIGSYCSTPSSARTPSPKVHFSPSSVIKHFFLSDAPLDMAEPVSTRYSLRCTMPMQFNPNFIVRLQGVRLPDDHQPVIEGMVRVKNVAFDKRVTVRFSSNNWDTYGEEVGTWVDPREPCDGIIVSSQGDMDTFKFRIDLSLGHMAQERQHTRILMCIRYETGGAEYWDNASGRNYEMEVVTRIASIEERKELVEEVQEHENDFVPSRAGLNQLQKLSLDDEVPDHDSTTDDSDTGSDISEPSPRRNKQYKGVVDHLRDVVGRDVDENPFFGTTSPPSRKIWLD